MLAFIDDILVEIDPIPVPPGEFTLVHNYAQNRVELLHEGTRIQSGVTFFAKKAKVDPKTGEIHQIFEKSNRIRAVFGRNHLDLTLPYDQT